MVSGHGFNCTTKGRCFPGGSRGMHSAPAQKTVCEPSVLWQRGTERCLHATTFCCLTSTEARRPIREETCYDDHECFLYTLLTFAVDRGTHHLTALQIIIVKKAPQKEPGSWKQYLAQSRPRNIQFKKKKMRTLRITKFSAKRKRWNFCKRCLSKIRP